jgi:riboflavin kinase/FMN adenylyltransferase
MVEGPTFGFGRDRGGDAAILGSWCKAEGLAFEVASPTEIDGRIVSSSRIRAALADGRVDDAALLLGRPHRVRGTVGTGAKRGRLLGFPTANLDSIDTQIPADGVYAGRAIHRECSHPAAIHIGPNATFGERARTIEVHLLDFTGDLYGSTLAVDFLARLRGTVKFDGVEPLLAQIQADVAETRRVLEP